jgi:cilla- and flagella-associated protein
MAKAKALTPDLIFAKSKTDNLSMVRNLNLWGNDLEDLRILRGMPNLEVLSLSVNQISSLKEFANCPRLQELYLRKNNIKNILELDYLASLQNLRVLWLSENPCANVQNYRNYVLCILPTLTKLDNVTVTQAERSEAMKLDIDEFEQNVASMVAAGAFEESSSKKDVRGKKSATPNNRQAFEEINDFPENPSSGFRPATAPYQSSQPHSAGAYESTNGRNQAKPNQRPLQNQSSYDQLGGTGSYVSPEDRPLPTSKLLLSRPPPEVPFPSHILIKSGHR